MIIADLRGGLGNQMFQHAVGRALSLRLGIDLDLYEHNSKADITPKQFSQFNIQVENSSESPLPPSRSLDQFHWML